jgi:hypothetical protein
MSRYGMLRVGCSIKNWGVYVRRLQVLIISLATVAVTGGGILASTGVAAAADGLTWGTAQEVPGTAALNTANIAQVTSMSCSSAGNCVAGGYYAHAGTGGVAQDEPFVVSETNGTWGTAAEVTGASALNTGNNAQVTSVSCGSAGNCLAGGYYTNSSSQSQAFIANETNGTWTSAEEVPGITALNAGGIAEVTSVSCGSAGNCVVGGYYTNSDTQEAFVSAEKDGAWSNAEEVPGTASLNTNSSAEVTSVSCASAGNCVAGGYYDAGDDEPFVADEANGTWTSAEEVPGMTTLNTGYSRVLSVECVSAGNCAAGGWYHDSSGDQQAFVVNETNGTWGTGEGVPGIAALNTFNKAQVTSVSCASAGNCAAGGYYTTSAQGFGDQQAFVVNETNGTWSSGEEVPGTDNTASSNSPGVNSVACVAAGNCVAGGFYTGTSTSASSGGAFVDEETGGTWGAMEPVPGTAGTVTSLSCLADGYCAAGGSYGTSTGATEAYVDETAVPTSSTTTSLSATEASSGVQLTATVAGAAGSGTPAGTVKFADGSTSLGSVALSGGKASVTDRSLPAGANDFTATFTPSSGSLFTGSTGTADETLPFAMTWVQSGSPSISGTAAVGDTLTAHSGTWGPSGVRLVYQWYANGAAISGATGTTLGLGTAEYGKKITVEVTGFANGDITVTATSAQSGAIGKGTLQSATPKVTGTAKVNDTLRITLGTWTSGTSFTYQWLANGSAISKATGSSFKVGSGQESKRISVRVTGAKTDYNSVTKTSAQTGVVPK